VSVWNPFSPPDTDEFDGPDFIEFDVSRRPLVLQEEIGLRFRIYRRAICSGGESKALLAHQIERVVSNPTAIYRGLGRPEISEGLCWVGLIEGMRPAMFRLLVFANYSPGADCWIIHDFEPRIILAGRIQGAERFDEVLWEVE
jgi:hypothetical protein